MMYALNLIKKVTPLSAWRIRSAVRVPDGKLTSVRCWGHRAVKIRRLPSDIAVLSEVLWENVYDQPLSLLKACSVFVDLGANIGMTSVLIHERFPSSRILAFEPHPENYRILKANVPQAETFEGAVWSTCGGVSLTGNPEAFDSFRAIDRGSIKTYTMGQIVSIAGGNIDFLKIDIEGAEVEIFKEPSWLSAVKVLAIEFHRDSRATSSFDDKVKAYGFQVQSPSKHTTVAVRG